jgi:hypothetical protein
LTRPAYPRAARRAEDRSGCARPTVRGSARVRRRPESPARALRAPPRPSRDPPPGRAEPARRRPGGLPIARAGVLGRRLRRDAGAAGLAGRPRTLTAWAYLDTAGLPASGPPRRGPVRPEGWKSARRRLARRRWSWPQAGEGRTRARAARRRGTRPGASRPRACPAYGAENRRVPAAAGPPRAGRDAEERLLRPRDCRQAPMAARGVGFTPTAPGRAGRRQGARRS